MALANMHIHSEYSFDSQLKLKRIAKVLSEAEICYGAITDHVEFCINPISEVLEHLKLRNFYIDQINFQYGEKFHLLKAVEVSEPHLHPREMEQLQSFDLDYILGSIHRIERHAKTLEEKQKVYQKYYADVFQMVEFGFIDAVGHLDYINRYYGADYSDFYQVQEVIDAAISNQILLEVNTSAKRRVGLSTFPCTSKLMIYQKSGGTQVLIGTDAHQEPELLDSISEVSNRIKLLKLETGIYKNRKFERI